MKIGKYTLNVVNSGYFALDGGAMFGIIPKPLWEKDAPADEKNRIRLSTKHILLQSESKKILIDTGMGNKWSAKQFEQFGVENPNKDGMAEGLKQHGLTPSDITDVILTHLHFDHTGGSVIKEGESLIPYFEKATYYVQEKNFQWGLNPSNRDKGSYIKENFVPLAEHGVLQGISGPGEFLDDEFELFIVNGHTYAQQLIKISDGNTTLLHCGDLMPTVAHIPYPYIMGYDLQPLITLQEKETVLPTAYKEGWKLFFGHDPNYAMCTLKDTGKGFAADERFATL